MYSASKLPVFSGRHQNFLRFMYDVKKTGKGDTSITHFDVHYIEPEVFGKTVWCGFTKRGIMVCELTSLVGAVYEFTLNEPQRKISELKDRIENGKSVIDAIQEDLVGPGIDESK